MASPTPTPIEARRFAWSRLWRALLAEPPTEHAPGPDADPDDEPLDPPDDRAA